jgi:hypothetical protein
MARSFPGRTFRALLAVVTLVTDWAAVLPNIASRSVSAATCPLDERWLGCAAHQLDTVLKKLLPFRATTEAQKSPQKTQALVPLFADLVSARLIVRTMKHAEHNGKLEKDYRLVQLSETRFHSVADVAARFVKSFDKVKKCLAEGSPQKAAMTAMAKMCVAKGVPVLVEVVARVSAVLKKAIVAMQYSNNPTLHRYLPTRAIPLAELEALRADAMSRKSKLNIYGLTPLPSDNENLVFANEHGRSYGRNCASNGRHRGHRARRGQQPLYTSTSRRRDDAAPGIGRFAYVKDDSVRARLLSDGEEMLRPLAQQTAEGQKEAAVAADKEAADKGAAAKEAASGCISGSSSKGAAWTTGGAYGLLLSHSVHEADVVVADKRDEVARMLQYKPTPQQLQKLRGDLPDDGDALVLYWHGRSTFPQLYAVALRVLAVHPSGSESERNFSGAEKTLTGERSSLSSLRMENEIYIHSFLLDQRKKKAAKARARGVIG